MSQHHNGCTCYFYSCYCLIKGFQPHFLHSPINSKPIHGAHPFFKAHFIFFPFAFRRKSLLHNKPLNKHQIISLMSNVFVWSTTDSLFQTKIHNKRHIRIRTKTEKGSLNQSAFPHVMMKSWQYDYFQPLKILMKLLFKLFENAIWNLELCHKRKQQDNSVHPQIYFTLYLFNASVRFTTVILNYQRKWKKRDI